MRKFATDHENERITFAEDIRGIRSTQRVLGEPVPNRFHPECSKDYNEWLKNNLARTIESGPNVTHIITIVGSKHQVRLYRLQEKFDKNELEHQRWHAEDAEIIAQLKQYLRRSRQCMS